MNLEATNPEKIMYEQPLNEPMRICLRLEHLFLQFKKHLTHDDYESSKHAVLSVVKIIDVINRPDLKSKLAQTLRQHATTLGQLERFPNVDPSRMHNILNQLDSLIACFHQQKSRIGERLRNNEFLNHIRLRLGNPGGACIHSIPSLALWLRKSSNERVNDLESWASEISELRQSIEIILYLTRNSNEGQQLNAFNGFYHQNLDPTLPCDLIRVNVPTVYNVYPEFSVGKHRFSIRFLTPNYRDTGHPSQARDALMFDLMCCGV